MGIILKSNEIESIPSGILSLHVNGIEVRIVSVSENSLVIRMADVLEKDKDIELKIHGYDYDNNQYNCVILKDAAVTQEEREEFSYWYRLEFKDEQAEKLIKKVIADYNRYVVLKYNSIDNEFSYEMTGYPADLDYEYYNTFNEQKHELCEYSEYVNILSNCTNEVELAVSLDNYKRYRKYLDYTDKEYFNSYITENIYGSQLKNEYTTIVNNISENIKRLYIGNQFCHNLMCETKMLIKNMDKALKNKKKITLCYSYIKENMIEKIGHQLKAVYDWCDCNSTEIEIVVNDYGMIELINNNKMYMKYMTLSCGVLLNKVRKDPRYTYKNGTKLNRKMAAGISYRGVVKKLNDNGVFRLEYESCGHMVEYFTDENIKASLHFPYYQTNTSHFCPLISVINTGDRNNQKDCDKCRRYCEKNVLLFPKHLHMVGIYNSIFGLDKNVLENSELINKYISNGIDRIVLNYL